MATSYLTNSVLAIMLAVVIVLWWWILFRFLASRRNVSNNARVFAIIITLLCIISEAVQTLQVFSGKRSVFGITYWNFQRMWIVLEVNMITGFLVVTSDLYSWLNYSSLESLLLKPNRLYRHIIYVGVVSYGIFSVTLVFCYISSSEFCRGLTIGWLLSGLLLHVWALFTLWQSMWDVYRAEKKALMTIAMDSSVSVNLDFSLCELEVDAVHIAKRKKKTYVLGTTLSILAVSLFFDLVFGAAASGMAADLILFVYGIILKAVIGSLLWQRRGVTAEELAVDPKYMQYRPFQTFRSGDHATRTVKTFMKMVSNSSVEMQENHFNNEDEVIYSVVPPYTPEQIRTHEWNEGDTTKQTGVQPIEI